MDTKIHRIMEKLASVVEARRTELGYSQQTLAKKAGMSLTYISEVERAERNPSISSLFKLADALDCEASQLLQQAEVAVRQEESSRR
jgi:transcriptional regulator with XRE-family HTH domain